MDPLAKEAQDKMGKSIEAFENSLGKLRSGRANPAMLSGIKCDYYGEKMDISTLCSISMPEPRQLLVRPFSRDDLKSIAAAIAAANIGVNPQTEADAIRIIVPPLTEDIRKDIAKQAKALAEDGKVSVRNIRRDYLDLLKEDDSMSDDYKERVEDDIQKSVDEANKKIEEILAIKQKEIMTI
ncbi:MAG: ribosome recycling factor [Bacilli bacterium]|jgi:ribosome recycling factor|nr:ribosome recycling factor [Bacilli bacterium]MCH4210456.1 ribosome recycling factor [Bacilli bacterium]MCH4228369.1 ribosome recycling factor [Bacilli bacterium]MCH4277629.1 ribosome recycling factor [Bacilli bacterium]MCI2054815.1 ribosome recycling factor [Bacilli bacterium]